MLIYEGRAIKLDKTSRVTIKDLREKLLDTKIQLIVGKSRIEENTTLLKVLKLNKI